MKKPASAGFLLLELGFFVDDVLARLGIVLLDLDLIGRGALVLGGGIEVAGAGRGFELDLLAHGLVLSLAGLDLGEHGIDAELVDAAESGGGPAQPHPAALALEPEAAVMQVGLERADGLVVGVRDVVALHRLLAGDLADSGHRGAPGNRESRGLYRETRAARARRRKSPGCRQR